MPDFGYQIDYVERLHFDGKRFSVWTDRLDLRHYLRAGRRG